MPSGAHRGRRNLRTSSPPTAAATRRTSLRSSASSTPSPTRLKKSASNDKRGVVNEINGLELEEGDTPHLKSGLESVDICYGGSSIDSDASGNENINQSHTNGTSVSVGVGKANAAIEMNGVHDSDDDDDSSQGTDSDDNDSNDSMKFANRRIHPDKIDETPGAALDVESPDIHNIEDNSRMEEESIETHEDDVEPAAMELEANHLGVPDVETGRSTVLSPIKPLPEVEGSGSAFTDAILISPPKVVAEKKDFHDRKITVNLANSSMENVSIDNCIDIEDEFLCDSPPLSVQPSFTKLNLMESTGDEDSEIQGFLEIVPSLPVDPSAIEQDGSSKSPGSSVSASQVSSLRSSPTSMDTKPEPVCVGTPSASKRAVRNRGKASSRKSSTQSPAISRSSSIDSNDQIPSSNPTPDGKSRLRIKSRRESKIGTLKVEKGSLEDNKDFMAVTNIKVPGLQSQECDNIKDEIKESECSSRQEETEEERVKREEEDRREVEKRLKSFRHITENHYLCPKKINKQFSNMQCDCEPRDDQSEGCGDDCANKMLMIECGKDCLLENKCGNKRFQNKENASVEVFRTDWKGVGVRATKFIPRDTFIMEYVGEALDHKQFRRRAKQYSRNNVEHFYFMALSTDCYVDATNKGNISRFINHSCDPNSETQKWIVNGESRVGFFTKRDVRPMEELNFDYKYERYGQAAQKCYCGTALCRGWLGKEPTSDSGIEEAEEWTTSEEEYEEGEEEIGGVGTTLGVGGTPKTKQIKVKEPKQRREDKDRREKRRRKAEERRRWQEEEEWNEEINRLASSNIKNRMHTLQLCRLMVRASTTESRSRLSQLLLDADQPCKRLFLDYQGLRILSQWMQDLAWSIQDLQLKIQIQDVLSGLPIPHRTMLKDSKVWSTMQKWSVATNQPNNPSNIDTNNSALSSLSKTRPNEIKRLHSTPSRRRSSTASDTSSTPLSVESMKRKNLPTLTESVPYKHSDIQSSQKPKSSSSQPQSREESRTNSPTSVSPQPSSTGGVSNPCGDDSEGVVVLNTQELDQSSESDIQILHELTGSHRKGENQKNIKENSDNMQLKVVQVEEVEVLTKPDSSCSSVQEMTGDQSEAVKTVMKVLTGQSEAGPQHETETELDVIVLPNHREELPQEEDEQTLFIISQISKIQAKARELIQIWSLLQEVFKIPKKERQKLRVQHEKEVDRSYYNQYRNNSNNRMPNQHQHHQRGFDSPVSMQQQWGAFDMNQMLRGQGLESPLMQRNNHFDLGRNFSPNFAHSDIHLQQQRGFFQQQTIPTLIHQAPDRASQVFHSQMQQPASSPVGLAATGHQQSPAGHKNRYQANAAQQIFQYDRSRQSSMIVVPRERKNLRLDDQFGRLHKHGLSRDERRTLFEAKVKEEARHKAMKSIILAQHNYYCRALGLRPKETPLFDKYPEYVFVGDKWIDLPKPSSVGLAELSPEDADSFSVPKMAWLPDEAYRATDPKAVNPRDIYPPGICPPEPAPPPRIIRVPGREATEWDVMLYYEEIYKQQPKSEPGSPSRPENVDNGEIDAMALSGALKRKLPPYPGHEHIPATPKVIFFDPDAGKPAPLPKEDPTPVAGPPVAAPVPAPVPAPMPAPTTAGGSQLPGSESATPLPAGSGTGTPVQVPGTPSGGSSTSRPESRADSLTGGWVTSSSIITPTAAPSALKCLTPFSISTSSNKRKQGSINLDTFEPTPVNSRQKLEPEQKGDQRKRRSLDADLQACVAGGQQDPAAIGQKPPGQSLDNSLMDRIRAELKLGPQVDPDRISLDQELSPDYKSPSPVERRNSLYTSPSPSPIPRTETETEVSIKRTAPRTIDHTNSEPTYGVEEKNSIPFSNTGGRSELRSEILGQVNDPAELEFCDTLPTSATNNLSDVGLPVASTIMQANTSTWTSDSVEANGVPTNGNGTESNGELVIRLPRSWRAARDGSGRVYYYHVEERVPQWEPPVATQQHQANNTEYPTSSGDTMSRDDMEMETETSSEDSEEDEDEEKENTEENCEPIEENELVTDYDLSASEKKMLLRMRDRSQSAKQERSNRRKAKRRAERERREQEREMLEARSERHRTTGLVAEMLIPRDRNNSVAKEIREKLKNKDEILRQIDEEIMMDEFTERQEQDRLRREQIKAEKMKREITQPRLPDINIPITPSSSNLAAGGGTPASKAAPAAANSAINIPGLGGLDEIPAAASSAAVQAADTSGMAEAEKRAKDKFIKEMSGVIVKALTPFRMKGCKKGFIKNNEDFKHLAKKLTHVIYEKERARVNSAQAIKLSDKMREKATEYVKKKMNSYDREYKRSPGHK